MFEILNVGAGGSAWGGGSVVAESHAVTWSATQREAARRSQRGRRRGDGSLGLRIAALSVRINIGHTSPDLYPVQEQGRPKRAVYMAMTVTPPPRTSCRLWGEWAYCKGNRLSVTAGLDWGDPQPAHP